MTKQTKIGLGIAIMMATKVILKQSGASAGSRAATALFVLLPSLAAIGLLASPLSAKEPAVPDFSKGMPDTNLERREVINGNETFHLKTALSSKEFSATLGKFLGAGWRKRKLSQEEMILAASRGRTSNREVSLSVYENAKVPGVEIHVIHLKRKEADTDSSVEISVIQMEKD